MKRIALFAAASLIALGTGFAYAQSQAAGGPDARQDQRFERRSEMFDRRIGRLKAELKLNAQQEALFAPVEAHIRKVMGELREARAHRGDIRNAELPARLDMMAERAAKMSANMRELSTLVKPLWATLDDGQKATIRKMMPGQGGRGSDGDHHRRWRDRG